MGTLSFNNDSGTQLFSNISNSSADRENLKASELLDYIKKIGLTYKNIKVGTKDGLVRLEGEVDNQEQAEKIALAVGNVKGVETVDNRMRVTESKPESKMYTVKSGDTLSKISQEYYGDAQKYNTIFEANKPMLSDPNKIYPGQVLRIPAQQ